MMRQKHSLKLQTKMETERLVLMVSEKKQRKIILNLKKNFVEGEKYKDMNVLKLNYKLKVEIVLCIHQMYK